MRKRFPSRKDPLVGMLFLTLLGGIYFLLGLPFINHFNPVPIAIWVLILSLFGFVWFGARYVIEGGNLICKMGPLKERILPITDILSIQRSYELRNSSSGPSFKKLKLAYRGGEALITPAREGEFIDALKVVNPKIFVDLNLVTRI